MSELKINKKSIAHILPENIANRSEQRNFVSRSDTAFRVKYEDIVVREGFNLREDFGDLESLADSIAEVGLQFPITIDTLKDGKHVLTDGERRYRAIGILRKRSAEFKKEFEYVDAKNNDRKLSESDRLAISLASNTGKPFEPLEEAEGFKRLRDGWNGEPPMPLTEIAKKTGRSLPYVEQRLLLADASVEEKQMVKDGKTSVTAIQTLARIEKNPEARVQTIKKTIEKNKGKKFQVKHVVSSGPVKLCDEGLEIIKMIQKEKIPGKVQNLLIELDAKFRGIRKSIK